MQPTSDKTRRASHTLTLVWWVFFVCLAQNAGLTGFCGYQTDTVPVFDTEPASTLDKDNVPTKCELTKQLLPFNHLSFDDIALPLLVFVLALITWLVASPRYFPPHTEPIRLRRRLHLRLCVFQE